MTSLVGGKTSPKWGTIKVQQIIIIIIQIIQWRISSEATLSTIKVIVIDHSVWGVEKQRVQKR